MGVESPKALSLAAIILTLVLAGCGKGDDNSPSMGEVAPKPNPGAVANAPGGGHGVAPSDMGASALGPGSKKGP